VTTFILFTISAARSLFYTYREYRSMYREYRCRFFSVTMVMLLGLGTLIYQQVEALTEKD
jgi:uncharacterized membrane protein